VTVSISSRFALLAGLCVLGQNVGCASGPRFKDQPIVWRVDDARHIAEPEEEEYLKLQYFADVFALRRLTRQMEVKDREHAHNTNALDEVPDSTWFQNRIGRRAVTQEELTRGPSADRVTPPLTITGGKVGGGNAGFIVLDANKKKFLIKFDRHPNPEMQTGAAAIGGRLFWAMGYFVPSDNVFTLRREDLIIGPKASWKDDTKDKHPFTVKELDSVLATSPRHADGTYRALASQLLEGEAKGGCLPEGVRDDDPNDHVRHEHRRELRGLRVFAAWTGHTDMKQDNTLDMYIEEGGRKFLRHHLIDFGEIFAGHHAEKGNRDEDGWEHYWDWENQTKAFLALGFWTRPWENRLRTKWPAIGAFAAEDFDPHLWREAYPYFPFMEADAEDHYWGAKIVMRFERSHVQAAVATGQFSDPEAAAYLVETLLKRRYKVGMAYLESLTSFDDLTIGPGGLCGVDLGVRYRLASGGDLERLDVEDDDVVAERVKVAPDGRACLAIPRTEDYTVYRIRARRGTIERPPMEVHLKGGANARILGIIRRAD
jgi:hypothetical protein